MKKAEGGMRLKIPYTTQERRKEQGLEVVILYQF